MATSTIVPLEEYLRASYELDCEYLDGELVGRNVGTIRHSRIQGLLCAYFVERRKAWGITALLSVRTRVGERRYRIPDLCIVRGPLPEGDVLTSPPWIWIEVLSGEDRFLRVIEKVREVVEFGCE